MNHTVNNFIADGDLVISTNEFKLYKTKSKDTNYYMLINLLEDIALITDDYDDITNMINKIYSKNKINLQKPLTTWLF